MAHSGGISKRPACSLGNEPSLAEGSEGLALDVAVSRQIV